MSLDRIPFERIDFTDERFRTSYHFPRERLRTSLEKVGLVQPILLLERAGRLVLLSGWRRALVLREIGAVEATACVLPEPDDLAAFRRVFYENASLRDFTVTEKSMIVRRLLELGEEEESVVSLVLPFFRMPPTKAALETLRTLSTADPDTVRLLQAGDLPPAGAVFLAAMSPGERRRVAPILASLGRNKQVELLEDLTDLSLRDGQSVDEILDSPEIRGLLENDRLPLLQKSEKIRERLDRKKNPRLWAWKKSFEGFVGKLGLPRGTALRADPRFETEELTLTLTFRSAEEFRAAIGELEKISRRVELEALFRDAGSGSE